MNTRFFVIAACAALVSACGPAAETQTPAARVSTVACETPDLAEADLPEAYSEQLVDGGADGPSAYFNINAAAGTVSCAGAAADDTLECEVLGPASFVYGTFDPEGAHRVPEGRSATFTYHRENGGACFLNEEG